MKTFLLSATAIVAMSGIVYAGDISDVSDISDVPEIDASGWTVTATGEATYYGYYNDTTGLAGTTASFKGEADVEKALDNGDSAGVRIKFEESSAEKELAVFYKSSLGEISVGFQLIQAHGVEVPKAPDLENPLGIGKDGLTFADPDLNQYRKTSVNYDVPPVAVTYASPQVGGFQLGAGINENQSWNVAVASEMDMDDYKLNIGASLWAAANNFTSNGVTNIGANVVNSGITYAAEFTNYMATGGSFLELGIGYNMEEESELSPFAAQIYYWSEMAFYDQGFVEAEIKYKTAENLKIGGRAWHDLGSGNSFAALSIAQSIDKFTLGAVVAHFTSGSINKASVGVDYAISSNITIGAGIGHDSTGYGAASGLKISF